MLDSGEEERLVGQVLHDEDDDHDTPMSPRNESPKAAEEAALSKILSPQRQTPSAPPEEEHEEGRMDEVLMLTSYQTC